MPRSQAIPIAAAIAVVLALTTVGLLRHGMGDPVADAQVSSAPGDYYRADLEALYLHEVRVAGDPVLAAAGDDELLARGHGVCAALDGGTPLPGDAALEAGIAVITLCAQHAGLVSS